MSLRDARHRNDLVTESVGPSMTLSALDYTIGGVKDLEYAKRREGFQNEQDNAKIKEQETKDAEEENTGCIYSGICPYCVN